MLADIALIAGAYLLGSLQHLSLLARLRRVELNGDFHQSLWREGGKWPAVIGVLGEFSKGVIPVLAGKALGFDIAVVAVAGLAAVAGQMWPVFNRFDGEKGNSVAIAMVFALAYQPALVGLVPVLVSLLVRTAPRLSGKSRDKQPVIGGAYSRSLPVGMFLCFLLLPFAAWYFGEPAAVIWILAALFVLMIIIRRLTAGLITDLKSGQAVGGILLNRLLYDRAAVSWRQ
jgi:glycerol-3-phosphate acyltransferase PlsY